MQLPQIICGKEFWITNREGCDEKYIVSINFFFESQSVSENDYFNLNPKVSFTLTRKEFQNSKFDHLFLEPRESEFLRSCARKCKIQDVPEFVVQNDASLCFLGRKLEIIISKHEKITSRTKIVTASVCTINGNNIIIVRTKSSIEIAENENPD